MGMVKLQDVGFILVFVVLLMIRRPKLLLMAGLISWMLAIPLFAMWIFFTAERLTWYGAGFILAYLLVQYRR